MKMLPGKQFENFYWMEGPLEGDQGCRITVLHPSQIQQCSHCLRREDTCPGAGVGKMCKDKGTKRGAIADYMRHLMLQHNYRSLKLQHQHEYPTLGSSSNDGFGHMLEREKETNEEDTATVTSDSESVNKEKITLLEQQLSEANAARQQQVMEIAKLKANYEAEAVKIDLNKSEAGSITVRATNFEYDEENDTLKVIDAEELNRELENHCTADTNRGRKIEQMRNRVLSQLKGIERKRRKRDGSANSVSSINSGVGVVRKRCEDEDDRRDDFKTPKLGHSTQQSLLPKKQ